MSVNYLETIEELEAVKDGVVLYWATWCGPCKMFKPVYEKVASTVEADFYAFDIDQDLTAVQDRGIMGVPTVVVYRDGEPVRLQETAPLKFAEEVKNAVADR